MFRKNLKRDNLFQIMVDMVERDLKNLQGNKESNERYIWCFMQIGPGNLKSGFFSGLCLCKGGGIIRKKDFENEFIEFAKNIEIREKFLFMVEAKEMGLIIRRCFQVDESRLISTCRFYNIRETLRCYTERRIFKGKERKEDKMKLTHNIIKQGGEKLRLP